MADQDGQPNVGYLAVGGLLLVWILLVLYFYVPWGSGEPSAKDLETKAMIGTPEERSKAVLQLTRLRDKGLESLRKIAREVKDEEARSLAIQGLGKLWDFDSMDLILAGLEDESEMVRTRAASTANRMLGVQSDFKPRDPLPQRQASVKKIQAEWKKLQTGPLLEDFKQRVKNNDPVQSLD